MRDALILPLNAEEELVITTDNSGAIGSKKDDAVKVPYEIVSYFSFRVAVMEMLASRANPTSIIIQNFCGEEAWDELVKGIQKGLEELQLTEIPITGSTESNFELSQSAIGLTIIGKRKKANQLNNPSLKKQKVALIGLPLVGNEVIEHPQSVVPLSMVKEIANWKEVKLWPVGSKGVLHELERMLAYNDKRNIKSDIDLFKSGGPSTSMLVQFPLSIEGKLQQSAGNLFHLLWEAKE